MSDVGSFIIGTVAVGAGLFVSTLSFGLASPLGGALISFGVGAMAQGLFGSPRPSNEDMQANIGNPDATLPVVYGTQKVGGKVSETWVQDAGDRENLIRAVDFCIGSEDGSGVQSIEKVWFDEVLAVSPVTISDGNSTTAGITSFFSGFFSYNALRGTDTQTVSNTLAGISATRYPSTWRHRGLAYFVAGLKKDQEKFPRIPNITALIKGNRVYDPRTGTWLWSNNPALCLLDYLTSKRYGAGFFYPERDGGDTSLSEIDEQSFIDAANYAEELVQDGSGGTQQRFTFDGWLDTGNRISDNVDALLGAMRGHLVFQNGQMRLVVRRPKSSAMTLTESEIIGDWSVARGGSRKVPNKVVVRYAGGDNGDTTEDVEWPEAGDTTFLDQDAGHEQVLHVDAVGVQDPVRAQQLGMVNLKEAREDTAVQVTATMAAAQLEVGDVVTIDHATPGWTGASAKDFWVMEMELLPTESLRLTLKEYAASVYSLDAQTRPTPPPGSNLPDPTSTGAPTGLTLVSDATTQHITPAGDKIPRIEATWTLPTDKGINRVIVVERKNGAADWNPARVLSPTDPQRALFEPQGGQEGDLWQVGVYVLVGQRLLKSAITTQTVQLDTDFVASDLIGTLLDVDAQEDDFDSDGVVEGRMLVDIIASGSYDLQFLTRQGRGTSWTTHAKLTGITAASGTQSQDVELPEKENAFVGLDVYKAGTTTKVGRRIILTFDPDSVAQVLQVGAWIADDGTPHADAGGDSDTAKIYLTYTTDGTEPATPTAGNAAATISAREGTVSFGGSVPQGSQLIVKARGENSAAQIAPVSTVKRDSQLRPGPQSSVDITPTCTIERLSSTDTSITYRVTGTAGPNGTGPVQVQVKENGPLGTQGSYGALQASPYDVAVSREPLFDKTLVARAVDTGAPGTPQSPEASERVEGKKLFGDPTDGRFKPTEPASGRWWDMDYVHGGSHWGPHAIGREPQVRQGFGGTQPSAPKVFSDLMSDDGMSKLVEVATKRIQPPLLSTDDVSVVNKVQRLVDSGALDATASVEISGELRKIARGIILGTAKHNDTVDFTTVLPSGFGSVPAVIFGPPPYTYHPSIGSTKKHWLVASAENLDELGFTMFLEFQDRASTAGQQDNFPAGTISSNGGTLALGGLSATAVDGKYFVTWSGNVYATGGPGQFDLVTCTATVAVQSKVGAGSWVTKGSKQYQVSANGNSTSNSQAFTDSLNFTQGALGSGDDIRIKLTWSLSGTGVSNGGTGSADCDPGHVTYTTSSVTPYTITDGVIPFLALEGQ